MLKNQVADVYGIRATLVDGGEIRGAGNLWICPEVRRLNTQSHSFSLKFGYYMLDISPGILVSIQFSCPIPAFSMFLLVTCSSIHFFETFGADREKWIQQLLIWTYQDRSFLILLCKITCQQKFDHLQ